MAVPYPSLTQYFNWDIDIGKLFPYIVHMGKIFTGNGWIIKVQGAEHSPVHVHVLHPQGKAVLFLDGTVINSGVPLRVVTEAKAWVAEHVALVINEWAIMGNPEKRES
jgi:hypothetical protein